MRLSANKTVLFFQLGLIFLVGVPSTLLADAYNGFDVRNSSIPQQEIHRGGPPRDGIPAIDKPKFIAAKKASFLEPNDRVLGLNLNGETKAYPISILNWHEVVNDRIDYQPVVITFCPLCGSGVAFSSVADHRKLNFGVSGLLYNSDVLLYDRQTESLWSQLLARAVSGPLVGKELTVIPLEHVRWEDWYRRYPKTLVLSRDTGFRRDYSRDPYAGYETIDGIYFPVKHRDLRYHPKERILGVEVNGYYRAYPFAELSNTEGVVEDELNGRRFTVYYDDESHSARIETEESEPVVGITAFWFAWIAFHPETSVFKSDK